MPKPDFFRRLGLYTSERFLDADLCCQLRAAGQAGRNRAGTVGRKGGDEFVVDPAIRSVRWVSVDETLTSTVRDRLLDSKAVLESFYDLKLTNCEPLQFLAYGVGDHYAAHRDSRPDKNASDLSRARRISAVVFLNEQSDQAGPQRYGGGALTFYGLVDHPSGDQIGIPLESSEGLLVTFPAHLLHAVAPVTHGARYTIATWFY